ncbi:MAG TPA: SDR family oxidoreductase [Actinomycetota bacterium]|nr:SDR family oxidoreductase [Actinomycetota bacterium]
MLVIAAAAVDVGVAELAQSLGELGPSLLLSPDGKGPPGATVAACDLASPEDAARDWLAMEDEHGTADVLVTVPSTVPSSPTRVGDVTDDLWSASLRDNLFVAANAARAAAAAMMDRGFGRIAMVTWRLDDPAGYVALTAACGAVRHLARTLASEVGEQGVTVNAVSVVPGRLADAAPAIRLLCSPDGGFVTSEGLAPVGSLG